MSEWLLALGPWKPVLTALVLPPGGPLLLMLIGALLLWRRQRRTGWSALLLGIASLWFLSCQATAVWMSRQLLPQVAIQTPAQLRQQQVQAVIVLGGGIRMDAAEYGLPQLRERAMERLVYGAWLSRQLGVPLGYAGGVGWGAQGEQLTWSEARTGAADAIELLQTPVTLQEDQSRDTRENGRLMAAVLQQQGIQRIALVTHAWHMPRALLAFEGHGLTVVPAPMGAIAPRDMTVLDQLPSAYGLLDSRLVLHEWLGLQLSR